MPKRWVKSVDFNFNPKFVPAENRDSFVLSPKSPAAPDLEKKLKEEFKEILKLSEEQTKYYPWRKNRKEIDRRINKIIDYIIKESEKDAKAASKKSQAKEDFQPNISLSAENIDKEKISLTDNFEDNPVLIGGCIKSGTTLFNDLLEYHPQVVTLLNDSFVFRNWIKKAQKITKELFFQEISHFYLYRLFNLNENHSPDLLNSGQDNFKKYKNFYIYLKYFVEKSKSVSGLISALPKSIFLVNGQLEEKHRPEIWVEKTPFNEFYFEKILKYFKNAKLIYIARNPLDNFGSIKKWFLRSKKIFNFYFRLRGLKKSYLVAKKLVKKYPDKILVIKYEDLVFDVKKEMEKVCGFLKIKYSDSLEKPTVFNNLTLPDSSHYEKNSGNKLKKGVIYKDFIKKSSLVLNNFENYSVFRKIGGPASFFGYNLKLERKINFWQKIIFNIKLFFGQISSLFILIKNKSRLLY